MQNDNTKQIRDNLIKNLVRIFTAYGWGDEPVPENYQTKYQTIEFGLFQGQATSYLIRLNDILQERYKDHQWGLYTPTFVEGVRTLLKAFGKKHGYFDIPSKKIRVYPVFPRNENIFKHHDYAREAIKRLDSCSKTTIRYSLIEEYGEERVVRDLRKVAPYAKLSIQYDEHEPDQLRDWLYDGGVTKMTVMYPIMPLVYITLDI